MPDDHILPLFGTNNVPAPFQLSMLFHATILENITESVIVTDLNGAIIYWSKGAQALFGYTAEEMLGKSPALLYLDRDENSLAQDLQSILNGHDYSGEWIGQRKDGTSVRIAIKTTLLRNDDGEVIGFLGVARDITARKEAEEIRKKLAAIVESSNDAIVSKTLDGVITSWNAAAERLFGYSAEEAVGKHITLIIPIELYDEEKEIIRKLRQGIRIQHYETVRVSKDGRRVSVSLSISPLRDETGTIIGAAKIARDISQRKELEQRRDDFVSMASHELKTPVTVLKAFTHIMRQRFLKQQDEELLRFVVRMDVQLDKLTTLISEMLDLSKMQNGQLAYHEEVFDLAELVRQVVEQGQWTTQTHQLLLKETVQANIVGDKERIGQVLMNLLTNAVKYSPDGERVIVSMTLDEGNVQVSVQDFGIGISPSYLKSIFERFYRVNEPLAKTYPGLGIGLYIARQIVERHGGQLWVESRKGEGSIFHFALPLVREEYVGTFD